MKPNEIEITPGVVMGKLNLQKDDIIIVTVDTNIWKPEAVEGIYQHISLNFPNHRVMMVLNGVSLHTHPAPNKKKLKGTLTADDFS